MQMIGKLSDPIFSLLKQKSAPLWMAHTPQEITPFVGTVTITMGMRYPVEFISTNCKQAAFLRIER